MEYQSSDNVIPTRWGSDMRVFETAITKGINPICARAQIGFIPLVIAVSKTRISEPQRVGMTLSELWYSIHAFQKAFNQRNFVFYLLLPYQLLRLPLSMGLELIGLNLIWTVRLFAGISYLAVKVIHFLRGLFERSKESDDIKEEQMVYVKLLRWSLAHPPVILLLAVASHGQKQNDWRMG